MYLTHDEKKLIIEYIEADIKNRDHSGRRREISGRHFRSTAIARCASFDRQCWEWADVNLESLLKKLKEEFSQSSL